MIPRDAAVIFDLDDTLYLEKDFVRSGFRFVAQKLKSFGAIDWAEEMESYQRDKKQVFQQLVKSHNLSIEPSTLLNWYRFHVPIIQLRPSAEQLLDFLDAHGHPLGILTDGRSVTQRNKLLALGILDRFDCIVISEEFGSEKPSERNYRFFEQKFPCKHFVYIGDNPRKDFLTPNRMGWITIGMRDDGRHIHLSDDRLPIDYQPTIYITQFSELISL